MVGDRDRDRLLTVINALDSMWKKTPSEIIVTALRDEQDYSI